MTTLDASSTPASNNAGNKPQTEQERQTCLLHLLRQALQYFITHQDIAATSRLLLDGLLLLSDSAFGFLGEVLHDEHDNPYLKTQAVSDIAWDLSSRQLYEDRQNDGMEFHNPNNLIGAVLISERTVVSNDPANDPRSGGLPAGHPSIKAFLGMPVHYGASLIGMVGLANRPGGYRKTDIDFLQTFIATYANLLEAARLRHCQLYIVDELQRARETAERADRAKTNFLSGWGHELRTPLNAILGHAQLLQMNKNLDAETRQQIDEIAASGEQFARLIKNLDTADTAQPIRPERPFALEARYTPHRPRKRILIAEDNPANQAVLRKQLAVLGYEAVLADDGQTALAYWQSGNYDLILVDRNMPNMNGLELAQAIRSAETSASRIPMIAITAMQQAEDRAICRQAGLDDLLSKPIELDALRQMLARWLSPSGLPAPQAATRQATDRHKILDTDYLARTIGDTDSETLRELIALFIATARQDLPNCRQYIAERNGQSVIQTMHRLKSSARVVGALRFAALAEDAEQATNAGDFHLTNEYLGQLIDNLNAVEIANRQLTDSVAPSDPSNMAIMLPELQNLSVLAVDNEPVTRRHIALLLASLGMRHVTVVDNGSAALTALRERQYDLLFCDLHMPDMDGVEFLRQTADCGYAGRLIIFSGTEERKLQSASELIRAKNLNLQGIVRKPANREMLAGILTRLRHTPVRRRPLVTTQDIAIRDGIRRDEFDIYLQPKVDAATLQVVGVEALARWTHNGETEIAESFIARAERHGLIVPLSQVLVTKALLAGSRLAESGHAISLSINLSPYWLEDQLLPEFMLASVQATGFKAENLILEIAETDALFDRPAPQAIIGRLKSNGFKLSIDDFGTGYLSEEQIIPFHELKLDRSFVPEAANKLAVQTFLASSIEMAKSLNLTTVAEGVETRADLELMRSLGCDHLQGLFVAEPMPVDTLIDWLNRQAA